MKFALPNATSSVFALSLIPLDFVSIFLLTENDSINEITAKVDANGSNELILFKFKLGILKLGKPSRFLQQLSNLKDVAQNIAPVQ